MLDTIIFDIGNVLFSFKPLEYLYEFYDKSTAESLYETIFKSEEWLLLDRGTITKKEATLTFIKRNSALENEIKDVMKNWENLLKPIESNFGVVKLLKEKGYRLLLFSNIQWGIVTNLRKKNGVFTLFDGELLSFEEKCIKPETEIYMRLKNKFQLDFSTCLFIDDSKPNVEKALSLGLDAYVFTDSDALLNELKNEKDIVGGTMLKMNQKYKVKIEGIEHSSGKGIAHVGKDKIMISNVCTNEEVEVEIIKRIKDSYIGNVKKILKKSDDRTNILCEVFSSCGSCQYLHMNYEKQLQLKKQMVEKYVKGEKLNIKVHDVEGMENPYFYRNKMIIGFTYNKQRELISGLYEEFSHHIIPCKKCYLHDETCEAIIETIKTLIKKYRIELYQEDKRKGFLRHVLLRKGFVTNEYMIVLVVSNALFPARKNFVQDLIKTHPYITTVVQNVNTRKTSIVLGEEERVLYGNGYISDILCGLKFRISSKSFYQINHEQTEKLYAKAIDLAKLTGNETLIDAYSGIGTIGMIASAHVRNVISVELNKDAVKDAIVNSKMNKLNNVRFFNDDAGKFMVNLSKKHEKCDVVIMDPPRSGSTPEFMNSVKILNPKKVVYVSCDPKTLIRDLAYFKKLGYFTKDIYLYDMFPHTAHVESVVLMTRK